MKKLVYISEFCGISLEENANITKIEGDKTYCVDEFGNKLIFNNKTGQCYTDIPTYGARKYLKF